MYGNKKVQSLNEGIEVMDANNCVNANTHIDISYDYIPEYKKPLNEIERNYEIMLLVVPLSQWIYCNTIWYAIEWARIIGKISRAKSS